MSADEFDFQAPYDQFHAKTHNYLPGRDKTGCTFYRNEDNELACDRKPQTGEKPQQ